MRCAPSLAVLLILVACGTSHTTPSDGGADASEPTCDDGPTLPSALVGGFTAVGVHCGLQDEDMPNLGLLHIDACGAAGTWVPDGPESHGRLDETADGWIYNETGPRPTAEPVRFRVRVSSHHRGGAPVLELGSVEGEPEWDGWALRNSGASWVGVPHLRACAVRETWSVHAVMGSDVGPELARGEATYAPGEPAPWVEMGEAGREPRHGDSPRFRVWDAVSAGFDRSRYSGVMRRWDGVTGVGGQDYAQCSELDGDVAIAWRDGTLIVEADWLVIDEADVDGDGDREERVAHRTRMEGRPDACPP